MQIFFPKFFNKSRIACILNNLPSFLFSLSSFLFFLYLFFLSPFISFQHFLNKIKINLFNSYKSILSFSPSPERLFIHFIKIFFHRLPFPYQQKSLITKLTIQQNLYTPLFITSINYCYTDSFPFLLIGGIHDSFKHN